MLGYICRSSPSLTTSLLHEGVLGTIQHILLGPEATKRGGSLLTLFCFRSPNSRCLLWSS
jgi:hypothetical protein